MFECELVSESVAGAARIDAWWRRFASGCNDPEPIRRIVDQADPLTITVAAMLPAVIANLASCLPARRAMRIQPIEALRLD
jgi:ABC-type lipoprotein release transport system permease subunit